MEMYRRRVFAVHDCHADAAQIHAVLENGCTATLIVEARDAQRLVFELQLACETLAVIHATKPQTGDGRPSARLRIAFCVTCKGRLDHLSKTLPANLADNADYAEWVFVLFNYNSKDGLEEYVRRNHGRDVASGRLVVYRFTEPTPFRMAHAKNLSHRLGIHEGVTVLCNVDADNCTGCGFAHYFARHFSQQPRLFLWSWMIKDGDGRLPRGISGRIAVPASGFLLTGGYDERYTTWSPDDKDFVNRFKNLGYGVHEVDQAFLKAIPHNDRLRFREYPHAASRVSSGAFVLTGREHSCTRCTSSCRGSCQTRAKKGDTIELSRNGEAGETVASSRRGFPGGETATTVERV
jgi:ferredoxin